MRVGGVFESIEALLGSAEELGYAATVVDEWAVGDRSTLCLVQLVAPDDRGPFVPTSTLDAEGVRRHEVVFDNGWRLVGSRVSPESDSVELTTFWAADADAETGYEAFVNISGDYRSAPLSEPERTPDARPILTRTTTNALRAGTPGPRRLHLGLMLPQVPDYHYSEVLSSDLPMNGPHAVILEF